jgi:hypothetical protein
MKSSLFSLLAAASLATSLHFAPVLAGGGHDHGPKYGGVVREVKNIAYELVAKQDSLTLYLNDHGKPVSTQGATAQAMIYGGSDKTPIKLEPAGENRLAAKGSFKVGVGVRVIITTTLPGKPPAKASFMLK